ncbi:MAG: alkaline phosphatase family protein [Acidimicrobiia bacterium]
MEPVKPDYSGANVVNVMPALLGSRPVDWLPEPVSGARAVVLLVLDGLGWDFIASPDAPPVLAAMHGQAITTVVPSTTPAVLTSITTGLTPAEHGITGYRMRVDDEGVLNTIRWNRANGVRPPDPSEAQRAEPFRGRPVPVVTKHEFRNSGFTGVHLRGADFHGWQTTAVLVEHVRSLIASGEPLVYAYYPGVDEVGHAYGLHTPWIARELEAADQLVGAVLDAVPDDVAVVVTADHGQVQVGPDGWIGLGALDALVDVYAGDGRFRYLHARRGAARELADAARAQFDDVAWVFTRDSLLDDGWMGPDPTGPTRRRVGDVVLAAKGSNGFIDPTWPREAALMAAHGSLTPAEMRVPLLATRGRGSSSGHR